MTSRPSISSLEWKMDTVFSLQFRTYGLLGGTARERERDGQWERKGAGGIGNWERGNIKFGMENGHSVFCTI